MKRPCDDPIFAPGPKKGIGHILLILAATVLAGMMVAVGLTGCASTSEGTRTTTVAPDGTQTIVEQIDPFTLLQTKCLERKFEP